MPKVIILRSWPDDDDLQVVIEVEHSYPDELAEAAKVGVKTFTEALERVMSTGREETESE